MQIEDNVRRVRQRSGVWPGLERGSQLAACDILYQRVRSAWPRFLERLKVIGIAEINKAYFASRRRASSHIYQHK